MLNILIFINQNMIHFFLPKTFAFTINYFLNYFIYPNEQKGDDIEIWYDACGKSSGNSNPSIIAFPF